MGPSVRELARRIVDGERLRPDDVRAVVLVLAEAYEGVRSATTDAVMRRLPWGDIALAVANAVDAAEDMLTEDLRHARVSIACAKHLCDPANMRP